MTADREKAAPVHRIDWSYLVIGLFIIGFTIYDYDFGSDGTRFEFWFLKSFYLMGGIVPLYLAFYSYAGKSMRVAVEFGLPGAVLLAGLVSFWRIRTGISEDTDIAVVTLAVVSTLSCCVWNLDRWFKARRARS